MNTSIARASLLLGFALVAAASARAQTTALPASDDAGGGFRLQDVGLSVGEKAWFSSWDTRLIDTRIVLPTLAGPPVLQTSSTSKVVERLLPVTSIGARYQGFTLAGTVIPTTRFSDSDANGGSISRSEYDVSAGYALNDYINASLVYKGAKVSQATTGTTAQLLGLSGDIRLRGVLVGLFATAPVAEHTRIYGTVAFGPGHSTTYATAGNVRDRFNYSIAEIGLSYSIPSPSLGAVTLSAGYRIQVVGLKDVEFPTFSLAGAQISSDKRDVNSTTHGAVAAVSFSFY